MIGVLMAVGVALVIMGVLLLITDREIRQLRAQIQHERSRTDYLEMRVNKLQRWGR